MKFLSVTTITLVIYLSNLVSLVSALPMDISKHSSELSQPQPQGASHIPMVVTSFKGRRTLDIEEKCDDSDDRDKGCLLYTSPSPRDRG